jgi:hypothetical protein
MHTIVSICTVVLVKQLNCFFFFAHQRAAAAPLTMYLTYGSEQVLSYSFLGLLFLFIISFSGQKKKPSRAGAQFPQFVCLAGTKVLALLVQKCFKTSTKALQKS